MATVYRRGKIWWVRFQWRGQEIRKSAHTTSKAEARRYLEDLLGNAARISRGGSVRRTYDEAMTRFMNEHLRDMKPSSARDYIFSIKTMSPHFSGLHLDEITKGRLSDFIDARRGEGVTPARIRRNLACLSSMFTHAIDWEWADENPVAALNKTKLKENKGRERYLNDDEISAALQQLNEPFKTIAMIAVGTGMRCGEILSLHWRDIDLDTGEIIIRDSKTGSGRVCSMDDATVKLLSAQKPAHPTIMFLKASGKPPSNFDVSRVWARACEKAGIKDCRFHDLRHTYASRRVKEGHDLYRIGKQLGHKAVQTTARYSHLQTDDLHKMHRTKPGTSTTDFVGTRKAK